MVSSVNVSKQLDTSLSNWACHLRKAIKSDLLSSLQLDFELV